MCWLWDNDSGWWFFSPSEKCDFVNWDDDIPKIWENAKNGNQTTKQWCSKQPGGWAEKKPTTPTNLKLLTLTLSFRWWIHLAKHHMSHHFPMFSNMVHPKIHKNCWVYTDFAMVMVLFTTLLAQQCPTCFSHLSFHRRLIPRCRKIALSPIVLFVAGRKIQKKTKNKNWLVVSTPLKNISQLGWLFPIYRKIKDVPNHQPENYYR